MIFTVRMLSKRDVAIQYIVLYSIIFVNDYVKIGNIEVFKNFLRIFLKNPFP